MHESRNETLKSIATGLAIVGVAALGAVIFKRSRRMANIRGQTVLITGGSRGLGFAMAREFARHGCRIAICARDASGLSRAQSLLEDEGADVISAVCDVSDQRQVETLVNNVRAHYGPIDILVNNAGEILVAPIENTTVADFRQSMGTMFWGAVYPTLAVLPEMRSRRSGRIAAITSIGGKVSMPHMLAFSCAKFASVAFFEGLRAEISRHGVTVTTIAPGLMRTGSYVNARFKGQRRNEAAWFSTAASLPGLSMGAERAARQAVDAIRRGSAEKILSSQANIMARLQGAFPGLGPRVLSLVGRLLPEATADDTTTADGIDLQSEQSFLIRAATALGRRAGARLNQRTV
jgi:NAD(P)-dependent dehydrogenase (short-subunit alcohol dehydrogenase family)